MFEQSEQMKKKSGKTFFAAAIYTLFELKVSNLRPLLFITFSPRIPKILKVWTLDFWKWGQKDR